MTTRKRGDHWFVEQMALAGDLEKAWEILRISNISFANLGASVRARLLEGAQHSPAPDANVQKELLAKYADELGKIETCLGIEWVTGQDGHGYHVSHTDLEERLERLGNPDFVFAPDHGFPLAEASAKGECRDCSQP